MFLNIRVLIVLFLVLVVANIFIYKTIVAPNVLKVSVLEAGKGSAVFIQTQNRKTLLIDTGSDASILRALGTSLSEWKRNIDAVALTSDKTISTGGLSEVTSHYKVSNIMKFGTVIPYGTQLTFDSVNISILAPQTIDVSYGASSLSISSSTPKGVYTSDGKTFVKTN